MLKLSKYCLLFLIASCVLLARPLMAAEGIKGNLASVSWLEQNLTSADVLILDASPAQMYKAQHIPGAVSVDVFSYGAQEVPVSDMEQRFQSWGISRGKKILIYDQGGSFSATKLFYDLYYYGFPARDLLVLDGGMSKWRAAGGVGNEGSDTCAAERLFPHHHDQSSTRESSCPNSSPQAVT